jgi:hypothetical protein
VLFLVAADYRQQHPNYRESLRDLVDSANGMIAPAFGVRLDVTGVRDWSPKCDTAHLQACLQELESSESGHGEHWVIGVLGSIPRYTASFEELGMAKVPGRHFILRDVSDIAERAAIDRAFASFTPGRRDEIYHKRTQHKRLAVFLHEWGHTLGGLHTSHTSHLLHARYDDRMESYGSANDTLIAAGLEDRFAGSETYGRLLAALESAPADSFDSREHEALLAELRAAPRRQAASPAAMVQAAAASDTSSTPPLPSHPFIVSGSDDSLLANVADDDRATYRRAVQLLLASDPAQALETVSPLLTRYPDCYAVQHLGCGLAMQLGRRTDLQTICSRAQTLSRSHR